MFILFFSRESRERREGCIAEGSQLSAMPSESIPDGKHEHSKCALRDSLRQRYPEISEKSPENNEKTEERGKKCQKIGHFSSKNAFC